MAIDIYGDTSEGQYLKLISNAGRTKSRILIQDPSFDQRSLSLLYPWYARELPVVFPCSFLKPDPTHPLTIRIRPNYRIGISIKGVVKGKDNISFIEPNTLLQELHQYRQERMTGKGELLLIIDKVNRLDEAQKNIFLTTLRYSKFGFGIIISGPLRLGNLGKEFNGSDYGGCFDYEISKPRQLVEVLENLSRSQH